MKSTHPTCLALLFLALAATMFMAACAAPAPTSMPTTESPALPPDTPTPEPAFTISPTAIDLPPSPIPATPALAPDDWQTLPVIPEISARTLEIYRNGQRMGNNPRAFSKVGDCLSLSESYLVNYDSYGDYYNLGDFTSLQETIDYFQGSFKHAGFAVGDGFNTAAVLAPFRADPRQCQAGESPLVCEYRHTRPAFAVVSLGTDDYTSNEIYEQRMRRIIEISIEHGVVPLLLTKADNVTGDNYNAILANLSKEYGVPLVNFYAAVEQLPDRGLVDNIHFTGAVRAYDFSSEYLIYGWPLRNLTVLRALDAVRLAAAAE